MELNDNLHVLSDCVGFCNFFEETLLDWFPIFLGRGGHHCFPLGLPLQEPSLCHSLCQLLSAATPAVHSATRHGRLGAQWSQCEKDLGVTQSDSEDPKQGSWWCEFRCKSECPESRSTDIQGLGTSHLKQRADVPFCVWILFKPSVSRVIWLSPLI